MKKPNLPSVVRTLSIFFLLLFLCEGLLFGGTLEVYWDIGFSLLFISWGLETFFRLQGKPLLSRLAQSAGPFLLATQPLWGKSVPSEVVILASLLFAFFYLLLPFRAFLKKEKEKRKGKEQI